MRKIVKGEGERESETEKGQEKIQREILLYPRNNENKNLKNHKLHVKF